MKISSTLFFCALFIFNSISSFAQNWLKTIGGINTDVPYAVAIDGNKDVYVGGAFSGTAVNFNPGGLALNLTTTLAADNGFFAKYNAGGVLQWAIPYYRGSGGTRVNGIQTDASNNVYVTGWFDGTSVNFNPLGTAVNLSSTGSQDIFLAKYNSAGILQWARIMGGPTLADQGNSLAIDPTDNGIILTGSFIATTNFNPAGTAMTLTPVGGPVAGNADLFIAKYNTSGICQWIRQVGSSPNAEIGNSVVCDASGNIYIGGWYWSAGVNFNPGGTAVTRASAGVGSDLFLAKYNNTGILQWIVTGGGNAGADNVNGVALDATGNVYATGSFTGTTNFNPLGVASNLSASGSDAFTVKYNNSGILQWVKGAGGSGSDRGRAIAVSSSNTVLVGGQFVGTNINFNVGGTALPLTSAGTDGFVVAYTTLGLPLYGMAIGGIAGADDIKAFAIDNTAGKYLMVGQYSGINVNFDVLNSTPSVQTSLAADIIIGRYLLTNGHLSISTLPVSWSKINAERIDNKVLLQWETACEINNTGFTIERSTDGTNFQYAGYVASTAALDCGKAAYTFEDGVANMEGKIYYRLKQTDIDGKHSYSKTVVVFSDASEKMSVQVSPNPASNSFSISTFGSNKPSKAMIYNASGKLVARVTLGSYTNVDCSHYAPGMYYINYFNGDKLAKSGKIVISR